MKTVAFFMAAGPYSKRGHFWRENSVNSFKKWHPDIDIEIINEFNSCEDSVSTAGIYFDKGYEKVIQINADTITCARFDELLRDSSDIVAALDYPMDPGYTTTKYMFPHNQIECKNINAGLVCFNTPKVVHDILEIMKDPTIDHDQHAIQHLMNTESDRVKIIDFPYFRSTFVYNTRGLGTIGSKCIRDGKLYFGFDGPMIAEVAPTLLYKPVGEKLYNHIGKHVKMLHFAGEEKFENSQIKEWFGEDTIQFFKTHCACDWDLPY